MDFEAMIRAELAHGSTMEDIAKKVGGIMNSIQDEEKDKVNKRQEYIEAVKETFWANAADGAFGIEDVSAIALMVMQHSHPEWTTKDMDEFRENVEKNVILQARVQGKNPGEIIGITMDHIVNEFDPSKSDRKRIETFLNKL